MNRTSHPALAEHMLQTGNEKLRAALRATTKSSSAAEVGLIVDDAISHQAEPKCEICEGKGSVEWDDKEARARYGGSWGRCLRCRPYKMAEPLEPAPAQDEQNPIWGYAGTIGNLIAQLRTLDPDMEIYSPHRLDDGRIVLDGLTLSKEWKEGRWLRKGDDAKRVAVLWTQPDARPAQTEQQPVAVPDGWKLVPIKPDIEMVEAGYEASLGQPDRSGHARAIEMYEAMLTAAPIAQTEQQPIYQVRQYSQGWQDVDQARYVACQDDPCYYTRVLYAAPFAQTAPLDADTLAEIIRKVDGNHSLGAGVLAERIVAELSGTPSPAKRGDA